MEPASPSVGTGKPVPRRRDLPPSEEEHVADPASAQTLQEPDVSSLKELFDTTTLEEPSVTVTSSSSLWAKAVAQDTTEISPPSRPSSPGTGTPILTRDPPGWPMTFYIRIDLGGYFHTYPHLGGPFQSLQEAESAIDHHLNDLRHPTMWEEEVSVSEMMIQKALYWPDGTRKKHSRSVASEQSRNDVRRMMQAFVDKYNEHHNPLGDLAYELKDVVYCQAIIEDHNLYYHLNFTMKPNRADDFDCGIDNLFFAEVTSKKGEHVELTLSCFIMIKPNDNEEGHCYGCTNNGSPNMKHPNANAYTAGHLDGYLQFGLTGEWSDSDDDEEAKRAKLTEMFKCFDDPSIVAELYSIPPDASPLWEEMVGASPSIEY